MAREIKGWITVNGQHVPIFDGETQEDAVNRFTNRENATKASEQQKSTQIAKNEAEAKQLNKQDSEKDSQQLGKRLYLPDVSADEANKSSDILNLGTKQRYKFQAGSKITNVHVFAGKGCSRPFRDAEKYAKRYGGKIEDWQHVSGNAKITDGSKVLEREVHWVQGKDGKMHEAFIKFYNH